MIDTSLLAYWQGQCKAREQARAALPPSWREDPRPQMRTVCEIYIEAMLAMKNAGRSVVAIGEDDR